MPTVHDELKRLYGAKYTPLLESMVRSTEDRYEHMSREELYHEAVMNAAVAGIIMNSLMEARDAGQMQEFLEEFQARAAFQAPPNRNNKRSRREE